MSSKKLRRNSSSPSNPFLFDDGVDSRGLFNASSRGRAGRKPLQLCSQAAEALNTALSGECGDPILQGLFVSHVTTGSGSNRLIVTVELPGTGSVVSIELVLERLERAYGFLRSAVAAAICRRRTPELEFRVVPPSTPGGEEVKQ